MIVEEGPSKELTWLYTKAAGHSYVLHRTGRRYCVQVFDRSHNRVVRLVTLEDDDRVAIAWARAIFISYLLEQGLLPPGGAL